MGTQFKPRANRQPTDVLSDDSVSPLLPTDEWREQFDEHGRLETAALRAHEAVVNSSWAEKARYLQELFGQRLAAAITGVDDARTVGRWIRGQEPQHAQRQR